MSKLTHSDVNKTLTEYSTKNYCIEYRVFFSNHITHGIVALYKLGVSLERIQRFIEWYAGKLEKPEQQPEQTSFPESPVDSNVAAVLGKRISFFPIYEHYEKLYNKECGGSLEEFISRCFLPLSDGLGCALVHALIHIGYGYSIRNSHLVVEGMAYLHHSYAPIILTKDVSFGSGSTEILDVLKEIKGDVQLIEYMSKAASDPNWMPWYPGNAQKRVNVLAKDRGNELAEYVAKIKLPVDVKSGRLEDVLKCMDWVLDCSIILFLCSEKRNDFFLLHGVTGAWSLRQLLSTLKPSHVQQALACVKFYLILLLEVYLTQDCPDMDVSRLEEKTKRSWEEIVEEVVSEDRDEHTYKLVQVCQELSAKQPDKEGMYKAASLLSISCPFF